MGTQPCPEAVKNPAYWNPFISAPPAIRDAYIVRCGHLLGKPTLQAMVVATDILGGGCCVYRGIFVFDKITDPKPQLLFQVGHLLKGEAQISGYSTILTAEVDLNSSLNKGKIISAMTPDLFREFQWSKGKRTFVQVAFPGLFPDLTRYQAEKDQLLVNQGHQPWKLDAAQTAKSFATSILKMKSSSSVSVVSGGGPHDLNAVVHVKLQLNGAGTFPPVKLTLSRLEANITGGIWEVTAVESENFSITSPRSHERLDSPVTSTGSGVAFEGQIGVVRVLDHLYNDIGHDFAMSQNTNSGFGPGTFSTPVKYNASFHGGSQEGILALYHQGGAESDFGVVMLKVLVEA